MDHKNVKYVVDGGNYNSQVVELVDTPQCPGVVSNEG